MPHLCVPSCWWLVAFGFDIIPLRVLSQLTIVLVMINEFPSSVFREVFP